jgi:hypothetical protein
MNIGFGRERQPAGNGRHERGHLEGARHVHRAQMPSAYCTGNWTVLLTAALPHDLTLVTRNVGSFAGLQVKRISPWEA